jgi:hypothetical protein
LQALHCGKQTRISRLLKHHRTNSFRTQQPAKMRFLIHLRRIPIFLHRLLSRKFDHASGLKGTHVDSSQAIELYANDCRNVLREGGTSYSKWFFDENDRSPDFAFLQSFDMSTLKGLVHDYLVYLEVHFDPDSQVGRLAIYTLEVGPTIVRSMAPQASTLIKRGENVFQFETHSNSHHLRGSVAVKWHNMDSCPSFHTAEYSLTLIHPGTEKPTKTAYIKVPLKVRQQTINCPKCLGRGKFSDWAIPKAAYKSGLTGYALFSENTVCGHVGCRLCGGSGTSYEEWYLKEEQIDQANITPVVMGSGRVRIG